MEYAKGGELFEYVERNGNVEESKAKLFFAQLISGVHYMHRKKVVHRNLKLVSQGEQIAMMMAHRLCLLGEPIASG